MHDNCSGHRQAAVMTREKPDVRCTRSWQWRGHSLLATLRQHLPNKTPAKISQITHKRHRWISNDVSGVVLMFSALSETSFSGYHWPSYRCHLDEKRWRIRRLTTLVSHSRETPQIRKRLTSAKTTSRDEGFLLFLGSIKIIG